LIKLRVKPRLLRRGRIALSCAKWAFRPIEPTLARL
jgi:hypothetical protein